jgi:hypothetical protein
VERIWRDDQEPAGRSSLQEEFAKALFARMLWSGSGEMTKSRLDDPVYKKNLQRLIEHHRSFEDSKR